MTNERSMSTRWARFVRGWIAAAVSVFVALCSHMLAGGDAPGLPGILLCLVFAAMICIALSGRALSTPKLAIAVATSQFLFHGVFGMLGAAPIAIGTGHGMDMSGLPMSGPSMPGPSMSVPAMPASAMPANAFSAPTAAADAGMAMPTWMWIAHAIAAVVTVVALRFGERAFWHLAHLAVLVVRMLLVFVRPVAVHLAPASIPVASALLPPRLVVLSAQRHRGPPLFLAL